MKTRVMFSLAAFALLLGSCNTVTPPAGNSSNIQQQATYAVPTGAIVGTSRSGTTINVYLASNYHWSSFGAIQVGDIVSVSPSYYFPNGVTFRVTNKWYGYSAFSVPNGLTGTVL